MNLAFTKSKTDCGCGSKSLDLSNTIKNAKKSRKSNKNRKSKQNYSKKI
jgi:hypothetical protein